MYSRLYYCFNLCKPKVWTRYQYGIAYNFKLHSSDSKQSKSESGTSLKSNKMLSEAEKQLKRILSEHIEPDSPFSNLVERLITRTWISFNGEKTRTITIKDRKSTSSKGLETYRLAFDLAGFKQEDIQLVLHENILYIEARREEIGENGAKGWREFSYECPIPKAVKSKEITASIDSDGLLLIEAPLPQQRITGIENDANLNSDDKSVASYVPNTKTSKK